jgi:hypothetical protein
MIMSEYKIGTRIVMKEMCYGVVADGVFALQKLRQMVVREVEFFRKLPSGNAFVRHNFVKHCRNHLFARVHFGKIHQQLLVVFLVEQTEHIVQVVERDIIFLVEPFTQKF